MNMVIKIRFKAFKVFQTLINNGINMDFPNYSSQIVWPQQRLRQG
jgi:hypothetical protein